MKIYIDFKENELEVEVYPVWDTDARLVYFNGSTSEEEVSFIAEVEYSREKYTEEEQQAIDEYIEDNFKQIVDDLYAEDASNRD